MSDTTIIPPLRPCPFCGSAFLERENHTVYCIECNAGGPNSQAKNGAETWNRRSLEDELIATLDDILCLAHEREEFYEMYKDYPADGLGRKWVDYRRRMDGAAALLAKARGEATNV